jgi:hypothetical protein
MSRSTSTTGIFRVGDRVLVPWNRPTIGEIVEDRGPIGRQGRRLYSIRIAGDPEGEMTVEFPGEDLEPATDLAPALDTPKIIAYLKDGGLIAILRSNLGGGRNQPKIWLRLDSIGNVVYTFAPGQGFRGGQTIPFNALHKGKIFEPLRGEVVSFLESFGLDRSQANEVVSAVGTAP